MEEKTYMQRQEEEEVKAIEDLAQAVDWEEIQKQYIKGMGQMCPFCGHSNVACTDCVDTDDADEFGSITLPMMCNEGGCNKQWVEVYTLARIARVPWENE